VVRYQRPVYNAALRLLRDPEEAKDVAQTTFLSVFEHLADYDPTYKFYSWIYRIAVNESLNTLGRRKPSEEISGEEVDGAPGPDRHAESDQTRRAIEAALMRINPELRSVVVLRHLMHLSYEDMAQTLAVPEKTVKSRLYSARQQLRTLLVHEGAI
jgi:RNA polymerase sigma-70 factor (ECF subfamily)